MATNSEEERERLKQEYKEHYRKIKDAKQRLKESQQKGKIAEALNNMNPENLLGSMDEFLGKVREKVAFNEAKWDVAMDSLDDEELSSTAQKMKQQEHEEELKKKRAMDTLKQVKAEMGMLYNEIEKTAEEIKTNKTIGARKDNDSDATASE